MSKKKVLAFVLALTMVMGLGLTAFAADNEVTTASKDGTYGQVLKGATEYKAPKIKVKVPSELSGVYLNPYKIKVDVDGEQSQDTVVSVPGKIENYSNVPISVCVKELTGSTGGNAKLAVAAPADNDVTNSIYAFLQVAEVENGAVDWSGADKVVISSKSQSKDDLVVLKEGDGDTTVGGTAKFRISGAAVSTPKNPWTDKDKITISFTFSFAPQPLDVSSGNVSGNN